MTDGRPFVPPTSPPPRAAALRVSRHGRIAARRARCRGVRLHVAPAPAVQPAQRHLGTRLAAPRQAAVAGPDRAAAARRPPGVRPQVLPVPRQRPLLRRRLQPAVHDHLRLHQRLPRAAPVAAALLPRRLARGHRAHPRPRRPARLALQGRGGHGNVARGVLLATARPDARRDVGQGPRGRGGRVGRAVQRPGDAAVRGVRADLREQGRGDGVLGAAPARADLGDRGGPHRARQGDIGLQEVQGKERHLPHVRLRGQRARRVEGPDRVRERLVRGHGALLGRLAVRGHDRKQAAPRRPPGPLGQGTRRLRRPAPPRDVPVRRRVQVPVPVLGGDPPEPHGQGEDGRFPPAPPLLPAAAEERNGEEVPRRVRDARRVAEGPDCGAGGREAARVLRGALQACAEVKGWRMP